MRHGCRKGSVGFYKHLFKRAETYRVIVHIRKRNGSGERKIAAQIEILLRQLGRPGKKVHNHRHFIEQGRTLLRGEEGKTCLRGVAAKGDKGPGGGFGGGQL